MRLDKFTIKSQELIQNAQALASQNNNQQIEPEHLLSAMLSEKDGLAGSILRKLGVSPGSIAQEVTMLIARLPKLSGVGDVYIAPRTKQVLEAAFNEASKMKDQYVSIEHIFLAISDEKNGEAARVLNHSGVTKESILKVLSSSNSENSLMETGFFTGGSTISS